MTETKITEETEENLPIEIRCIFCNETFKNHSKYIKHLKSHQL